MKELKSPPVSFDTSVRVGRNAEDYPNAARHQELKASWSAGQRWETLVQGCTQWVLVTNSGFAEPTWDNFQEYRQCDRQDPLTPAA